MWLWSSAEHGPAPQRDQRSRRADSRTELVASGLANKEVAAQLYLSVATVEAHLSRVYAKLGVRSRAQLARYPAPPG